MTLTIKKIGEIGIDGDLCWIGDPCYVLHTEQPPKAIGKDWSEFCNLLHKDKQYPTGKQFNYDLRHPDLGVVVSTGYGDGVYPVFAAITEEGRVARVWVEFLANEDAEDESLDSEEDSMTDRNDIRAERAQVALQFYVEAKGEVFENSSSEITDLMADLLHLTVRIDQGDNPVESTLRLARMHFDAEHNNPEEEAA